jgi:hypothetical protein
VHSQYVHPQHPPQKEYRDDGPRDVNDPVASRFRFAKIEHAAMVAGPAQVAIIAISIIEDQSVKPDFANHFLSGHNNRLTCIS